MLKRCRIFDFCFFNGRQNNSVEMRYEEENIWLTLGYEPTKVDLVQKQYHIAMAPVWQRFSLLWEIFMLASPISPILQIQKYIPAGRMQEMQIPRNGCNMSVPSFKQIKIWLLILEHIFSLRRRLGKIKIMLLV